MTTSRGTQAPAGAELECVPRHLSHLYATTKLLARFESVERTIPVVLARATEILRLSTTVLIERGIDRVHTFVWHGPAVSFDELEAAKEQARRSFEYLAPPAPLGSRERQPRSEALDGTVTSMLEVFGQNETISRRLTLPLVVDRRPVFGVLHVNCRSSLDDVDLAFFNAVTNQIAVAVDRHGLPKVPESWLHPALMRLKKRHKLTFAEMRVSELVVRGLSNKEISAGLGTSVSTVRAQLSSVLRKTEVGSRCSLSYLVYCESHL